jgi:hypothetical protein
LLLEFTLTKNKKTFKKKSHVFQTRERTPLWINNHFQLCLVLILPSRINPAYLQRQTRSGVQGTGTNVTKLATGIKRQRKQRPM